MYLYGVFVARLLCRASCEVSVWDNRGSLQMLSHNEAAHQKEQGVPATSEMVLHAAYLKRGNDVNLNRVIRNKGLAFKVCGVVCEK